MFETHDSTKINYPKGLKEPGEHAWNRINLRINFRWFYVVHKQNCPREGKVHNIAFHWDTNHLIELINSPGIEDVKAYLVTPDYLNKSGLWEMKPLIEVFKFNEPEPDHDLEAHVYVINDGTRYVNSSLATSEENLNNSRSVYKADNFMSRD